MRSTNIAVRRGGVVARRSSHDAEHARNARMERTFERQMRAEEERALKESARSVREQEREQRTADREARDAAALRRTTALAERVDEMETFLRRCAARPAPTVADLVLVEPIPFDSGEDGLECLPPSPPVKENVGFVGRGKMQRWYDQELERYRRALTAYETDERARQERLAACQAEYGRREGERQRAARNQAADLTIGLRDGESVAVEGFVSDAITALPLPEGINLEPAVAYRSDPREVVVDVRLPVDAVVPREKTVTYVKSRDADSVKERSPTEREGIYRRVLAQLPLCVADVVFRALDGETVETVTVNGKLSFEDSETGQRRDDFLVSLSVDREKVDELRLDAEGLDPVRCVRSLGARLSPHPLAHETVPVFLTFDQAKYKLGSSVDVAAGLDGRVNLGTIPWPDFEQLVRELLLAMSGKDTRVTRRSRDDGIDGVVFDCDAAMGGEYVVQAKRYKGVVPALDVRALAGTMHDKRANHALFVTTSWFSPDGRRFGEENRVRLIEGTELRHLLLEHLELDVLVPEQRSRRRRRAGGA